MTRKRNRAPSRMASAARVLAERRAILDRLAALNKSSVVRERSQIGGDDTPVTDASEGIQESAASEMEFASRQILMARLKALARAEAKIEEGSYGRCDDCGQPIADARLRAVPEAARCLPCAQEQERLRGAGSRSGRWDEGRWSRPA